jgi:hypothetical protein
VRPRKKAAASVSALAQQVSASATPRNLHVDNLHWADRADTQDEAVVHYLYRRGERHAHSKLTTQEVARIRELVAQGATRQAVADLFEVSCPAISYIVRGLTRRHT